MLKSIPWLLRMGQSLSDFDPFYFKSKEVTFMIPEGQKKEDKDPPLSSYICKCFILPQKETP